MDHSADGDARRGLHVNRRNPVDRLVAQVAHRTGQRRHSEPNKRHPSGICRGAGKLVQKALHRRRQLLCPRPRQHPEVAPPEHCAKRPGSIGCPHGAIHPAPVKNVEHQLGRAERLKVFGAGRRALGARRPVARRLQRSAHGPLARTIARHPTRSTYGESWMRPLRKAPPRCQPGMRRVDRRACRATGRDALLGQDGRGARPVPAAA